MEDEGEAEKKAILTLEEQYVYKWIDSRVAEVGDKIVEWKKTGAHGVLFKMKSGFNLMVEGINDKLVLNQDESTTEKIRTRAKREDKPVTGRQHRVLIPI